jgi:hypothetical protein
MAKTKKHAAAVALGRLGGLKGGRARAKRLTAEQRVESARKGVLAKSPSSQICLIYRLHGVPEGQDHEKCIALKQPEPKRHNILLYILLRHGGERAVYVSR